MTPYIEWLEAYTIAEHMNYSPRYALSVNGLRAIYDEGNYADNLVGHINDVRGVLGRPPATVVTVIQEYIEEMQDGLR